MPLHRQVKLAVWRSFNDVADWLRSPVSRPRVLLITGQASDEKVLEIETRLHFLCAHLPKPLEVRRATAATPFSYVGNAGVATADADALTGFARHRLRWTADLDYETNPTDGWALMDLGAALARSPRRKSTRTARRIFNGHVSRLRAEGQRPVYLFGTGPSLRLAAERSFDDGMTIVCNTIVRDPELFHHLAPTFLTAGDAIYHFGHTAHARAFRADALKRLKESDGRTLFVYPAQFDPVVRSEFSELQSLLVPIPYAEHSDVTVDLSTYFYLPLLENVLANQLLPLGCTLSSDVRMWGFDGRAPNDVGFWANSDRHAYPELMQSIRDAHPAFFADKVPTGNETKYVKHVHGELLDERLTDAERHGFRFEMLHPSWTPTLQKRYFGENRDQR